MARRENEPIQFDDEEIVRHNFDIVNESHSKLGTRQKTAILLSLVILLVVGGIVAISIFVKPKSISESTKKNEAPFGREITQKEVVTTNKALRAGIESYNRGYYPDALTELNNVVESDAEDKDKAIALIYVGLIHEKQGNLDRAMEAFKRSEKYNAKNQAVYLHMAGIHRQKGEYDKAEKLIRKSMSMEGATTDTMILLGNIYYELGKYDEAIKAYQQALEKAENNGPLLYNLASALLKKGDEFSAIEYLKKAAATDRISEVAYRSYSRLGTIYTDRKDFPDAIKYLLEASKIRPGDPRTRYNLGIAYLGAGKKEQAIDEFVRAEEMGRDNSAMLEKIGEAYSSMEDYSRSLRVYEAIQRNERRNVRILGRLGELYYAKGEYDKALDAFRKITELKPATESARVAYLNMGNTLDEMQRYDDAIAMYQKALTISRKDHLTFYNMGIAYQHNAKPELAIDAWREASRLKNDDPRPQLAMANLYYEKGFFDEAEKAYREVTKDWPKLQEPHFKIGTIYYRQEKFDYALKAFKRVIELEENNDLARRAYINIGMISSRTGKSDENLKSASDAIKKAVMLKPNDPEALYALGLVYAGSDMHSKAIDTYYQALQASRDADLVSRVYNSMGTSYYKMKQYRKALEAYTRGLEENPSSEEIRMNRKAAMNAYEEELSRR